MKVLNAAPLTVTASSKATAFSMIMVMVQVSLFLLLFGNPGSRGGRGGCPSLSTIYKAARNFQSLARLKIIHHRNRKRQSVMVGSGGAARDAASCSGGEGGGRVSFAACPAERPDGDRAGGPSEGGELGPLLPVGRRAGGPCSVSAAGRWAPRGKPGLERGARHRIARLRKWCSIKSNSNAKMPNLLAFLAAKSLPQLDTKRPPDRSSGLLFQTHDRDQLAATLRPLRAWSEATRSTSASAAARASATHLLSTAGRP